MSNLSLAVTRTWSYYERGIFSGNPSIIKNLCWTRSNRTHIGNLPGLKDAEVLEPSGHNIY